MKTYSVGTRVFCDFPFSGKPRGTCIEVIQECDGKNATAGLVKVKLTETIGAYRKGEVLTLRGVDAVPVAQRLPLRKGQYTIRISTDYQWTKTPLDTPGN